MPQCPLVSLHWPLTGHTVCFCRIIPCRLSALQMCTQMFVTRHVYMLVAPCRQHLWLGSVQKISSDRVLLPDDRPPINRLFRRLSNNIGTYHLQTCHKVDSPMFVRFHIISSTFRRNSQPARFLSVCQSSFNSFSGPFHYSGVHNWRFWRALRYPQVRPNHNSNGNAPSGKSVGCLHGVANLRISMPRAFRARRIPRRWLSARGCRRHLRCLASLA